MCWKPERRKMIMRAVLMVLMAIMTSSEQKGIEWYNKVLEEQDEFPDHLRPRIAEKWFKIDQMSDEEFNKIPLIHPQEDFFYPVLFPVDERSGPVFQGPHPALVLENHKRSGTVLVIPATRVCDDAEYAINITMKHPMCLLVHLITPVIVQIVLTEEKLDYKSNETIRDGIKSQKRADFEGQFFRGHD